MWRPARGHSKLVFGTPNPARHSSERPACLAQMQDCTRGSERTVLPEVVLPGEQVWRCMCFARNRRAVRSVIAQLPCRVADLSVIMALGVTTHVIKFAGMHPGAWGPTGIVVSDLHVRWAHTGLYPRGRALLASGGSPGSTQHIVRGHEFA